MYFLAHRSLFVGGLVASSPFFHDVSTVADSYAALSPSAREGGSGGLVRFGGISLQPFWLVFSFVGCSLQTYSCILLCSRIYFTSFSLYYIIFSQ